MANSILADQLTGSNLGLQGQTPPIQPGANPNSTRHYESSINNRPSIERPPSELDLNGVTPPKYSDTFSEE